MTPGPGGRERLNQILAHYQVRDDPGGAARRDEVGAEELTHTEMQMLLADPARIPEIREIRDRASDEAVRRFPPSDGRQVDNETDAFRHAYGSALLALRFGSDWASRFTSAHEGTAGNNRASRAMDLYNNEIGRKIALANPDAAPDAIADLAADAVLNGETVVVGPDGASLRWSASGNPV
ncbi:DUF6973 domain-containing protein [Mycolicibacterium parafortuitum]|uniref:DUF6973 domain-containing protein n=1 Tax=Mycolicibacterium parafortuitum TaxID=39692 RepID=A0A375YBT7_MYCPF|nr:hypothetical protein [Mycolicibacterium parafortuitum]ORB31958.1 hypothetical protein BST38_04235 [Mycolicibacterium parafortuitum]SRX78551.1 hypothetical protein [Rhodococcus jostii RHA1] [Mycolicibacterium parafortuitum]